MLPPQTAEIDFTSNAIMDADGDEPLSFSKGERYVFGFWMSRMELGSAAVRRDLDCGGLYEVWDMAWSKKGTFQTGFKKWDKFPYIIVPLRYILNSNVQLSLFSEAARLKLRPGRAVGDLYLLRTDEQLVIEDAFERH